MTDTCKTDNQGRLMLPAAWRKEFKVAAGTDLIVRRQRNGGLLIETRDQAIARAQELVAKYIRPGDRSVVQELLDDRRRSAVHD